MGSGISKAARERAMTQVQAVKMLEVALGRATRLAACEKAARPVDALVDALWACMREAERATAAERAAVECLIGAAGLLQREADEAGEAGEAAPLGSLVGRLYATARAEVLA